MSRCLEGGALAGAMNAMSLDITCWGCCSRLVQMHPNEHVWVYTRDIWCFTCAIIEYTWILLEVTTVLRESLTQFMDDMASNNLHSAHHSWVENLEDSHPSHDIVSMFSVTMRVILSVYAKSTHLEWSWSGIFDSYLLHIAKYICLCT